VSVRFSEGENRTPGRSGWLPTQTPHRSVLARLTHTAPRFDLRSPGCDPLSFRGHVHGFRCTRHVSRQRSVEAASPSLHGVLRESSPASSLLWDAPTPGPPSRSPSLPSVGDTVVLSPLRPHQPGTGAGDQPGVGKPGLRPAATTEVVGSLRFPSDPRVPAPSSWTPVGPNDAKPLRRLGTAPACVNNGGSHDRRFRGSIARHRDSLSPLRSGGRPPPRKTRFRLLARLCRAGLVTRRVATKGF
jgi:hypothetical protein